MAETGGYHSLRPTAWSKEWVSGKSGIHREALTWEMKTTNFYLFFPLGQISWMTILAWSGIMSRLNVRFAPVL